MFISTYALLWVVAIAAAVMICVLVRQVAALRNEVATTQPAPRGLLPLGSAAPEFSVVDLRSGAAVDSVHLRGRRTVLCLLSSGCSTCLQLSEALAQLDLKAYPSLALYCHGEADTCREHLSRIAESVPILGLGSPDLPTLFRAAGLPTAIILDEAWKIVGYRYPIAPIDVIESLAEPAVQRTAMRIVA